MKKLLCVLMLMMLLVLVGCIEDSSPNLELDEQVVRIGYQKNGPLVLLQMNDNLEKRLGEHNFKVEWVEFQAGPLLVEALNAGSIDFGRTGNTPVIFAQAADTPFQYVAAGFSKYKGSGILVPEESDIKELKDLEGKTIGFANGSSSHFLIIKALEKAGLTLDDITPAYLTPGDARVAFEQGTIDAMVVWDPYVASTELHSGGRMLVDGEGLTTDRDFFVATNDFSERHPEIIDEIIEEMEAASNWANENHEELVENLVALLGIDEASLFRATERRTYGVEDVSREIIQEQQEIADIFYELELIPKKITVEEIVRD